MVEEVSLFNGKVREAERNRIVSELNINKLDLGVIVT